MDSIDRLSEVFEQAAKIVEQCNIPDSMQATAFGKAVDMLIGSSQATSTLPLSGNLSPIPARFTGEVVSEILDNIASRLSLNLDVIEHVFVESDGIVSLIVPPDKFSSSKMSGTREIALLIVAAKQCSGLEDSWTSVDEIRKWCEEYKKYDAPNFARALKGMKQELMPPRNKGASREYRLSKPGLQEARQLIERLAGSGHH